MPPFRPEKARNEFVRAGSLVRAGMRMIKRVVPLAALIGGAILAMVLAPDAALADKRVALVVGNSSYQTVPQLPNPSRDANAVAKMFRDAGFERSRPISTSAISTSSARSASSRRSRTMPTSPSFTTPATASKSAAPIT